MAQAGVRGEGLPWPSAGFRREPVVLFRRPFTFPGMCHPEPGRLSLANGGEGSALRFMRLSAVSGANVVAHGGEGSAFPFSRHSPLVYPERSRRATALHRRWSAMWPKVSYPPMRLSSYAYLRSVVPMIDPPSGVIWFLASRLSLFSMMITFISPDIILR